MKNSIEIPEKDYKKLLELLKMQEDTNRKTFGIRIIVDSGRIYTKGQIKK